NGVRNTQDCEAICVQTIQYCLEVGGAHASASHIRLLQDCADVCATTTRVLLRGSPHHAELATTCANICDACAASCEMFIGDAQPQVGRSRALRGPGASRQRAPSAAATGEAALRGAAIPGAVSQAAV